MAPKAGEGLLKWGGAVRVDTGRWKHTLEVGGLWRNRHRLRMTYVFAWHLEKARGIITELGR